MTHPVRFVSLCSDWVIHQAWFGPCAATWHRLLDSHDLLVMNDGGLSEAGRARIESLSGCRVERLDVSRQVERQFERSFPALALLRAKTPLMRKLTDLHFYFDADADVVHFAGPGKPWISIADTDEAGPVREVRLKDAPSVGVSEKSRLFVRLWTQDWVGR